MHIKDRRNHKSLIKKTIEGFYQAFYTGDRLSQYRYLSTKFQSEVPLNYYLVHSNYDADFGKLVGVKNITFSEKKLVAHIEVTTVINGKENMLLLDLVMDYGGWKIDGDSLFRVSRL